MAYTTPFFISVGDYVKLSDAQKLYDNTEYVLTDILNIATPGTDTAIQAEIQTGVTTFFGDADDSSVIFAGGPDTSSGAFLQLFGDATADDGAAIISVGHATAGANVPNVTITVEHVGGPTDSAIFNSQGMRVQDIGMVGTTGTLTIVASDSFTTSAEPHIILTQGGTVTLGIPNGEELTLNENGTDVVGMLLPGAGRVQFVDSGDTTDYCEIDVTDTTFVLVTSDKTMRIQGNDDDGSNNCWLEVCYQLSTRYISTNAQTMLLPQNASNPPSITGSLYYNTTDDEIRYYDGTTWQVVAVV